MDVDVLAIYLSFVLLALIAHEDHDGHAFLDRKVDMVSIF